ncbi:C6 transcription factor [Colletotrichum truncatum]|uniref:C6 transcription factor n=1 Tax=Colletotrichum truncatum TaxID=5467 RepID=A0ACC3YVP9_COLTU|nr:C6 transcription factor [Colletotrichum truncatum]KAF6791242.1 C6 transcription factor [Colletotrichum truncatum]
MSKTITALPSDEASPLLPRDEVGPHNSPNPSNLVLFRRAIGINANVDPHDECNLEAGRASALGIYAATIATARRLRITRILVSILLYVCHAAQLIIGAVLTAMGPSAGTHRLGITILGAVNTVVAGVLTFMKGQGMPEKLRKNETEFRRLQNWIEETEALIVLGVVGSTRDEVGELVAAGFKRWNLANERMEDVRPEEYLRQDEEVAGSGKGLTSKKLRKWR